MAGRGPYTEAEKIAMQKIWDKWNPEKETLLARVTKDVTLLPGRQANNVEKAIAATYGKIKVEPSEAARLLGEMNGKDEQAVGNNTGLENAHSGQALDAEDDGTKDRDTHAEGDDMLTLPRQSGTLEPPKPRTEDLVAPIKPADPEQVEQPTVTAGITPGTNQPVQTDNVGDVPMANVQVEKRIVATEEAEAAAGQLFEALSDLRKVTAEIETLNARKVDLEKMVTESLARVQSIIV